MPYLIRKRTEDGKAQFCVYEHDGDGKPTGDAHGCHPTRKAATEQMRALYAAEGDTKTAGDKAILFAQSDAAYTPVSVTTGEACAGCRWFKRGGEWGDDCQLVQSWPLPIEETGWCQMFELIPVYEPQPMQVEVVSVAPDAADALTGSAELQDDAPVTRKAVKDLIGEAFRSFVGALSGDKADESLTSAFKVKGNHWFAVWSNNFKDREAEIFPAAASDQYVARVDAGLVPLPDLWVWHLGQATRIGRARMVARHGHFMIGAGEFDDTWQGKAAQKYYGKHQKDTAFSHGYTYNPRTFDGRHYADYNTFELTTLPRGPEANRFTTLDGVKEQEMAVTEQKKAYLVEVFGKDGAEKILADLDKAGKALEDIGVEFKDFGHVADESPADKATPTEDTGLKELVVELIGAQEEGLSATLDAGKAFKAYKTDMDAKFAALQKAFDDLRAEVDLRPRSASKDSATLVQDGNPVLAQSQVGVSAEAEAAKETLPGLFKS